MGLFGKKETTESKPCCCGGNCDSQQSEAEAKVVAEGASVRILGGGCAKCNALEAATKAALEQLGMSTAIDHVTDYAQIAAYGVMSTPALVVDGKVAAYGKVLKKEEVMALLQKLRG